MNNPDDPVERLDQLWSLLAQSLDCAGPAREALFLAKLALLLSEHIGDVNVVEQLAAAALRDLD